MSFSSLLLSCAQKNWLRHRSSDRSALDRDFSVLCYAAGLDADSLGAAVMPETNRAVLYVPARVDLPACLAHEAQRTNVRTRLTELSRHIQGVRVIDKSRGDIPAHLNDLCCSSQVDSLSANLVSIFADGRLCNS